MDYTKESIILASIMFAIFIMTIVYEYYKSKKKEGFDNNNPMLTPFNKITDFFTYLGEWFGRLGDILTIYADKIIRMPILILIQIFNWIVDFFKMSIDFICSYSPGLETMRRTLLAGRETYSHPII
jgi:hypothetical protein